MEEGEDILEVYVLDNNRENQLQLSNPDRIHNNTKASQSFVLLISALTDANCGYHAIKEFLTECGILSSHVKISEIRENILTMQ